MRFQPKRFIKWAVLAALIGGVAYLLRPSPVSADFGVVERGPLRVTVQEEGQTRVRQRYEISAPVAGTVLRIHLEPGDPVKAHQTLLARFRPSAPALLDLRTRAEAEARVKAAEAALRQARALRDEARTQLDFAGSRLKRAIELSEHRIISLDQLEAAQVEARVREKTLEAADSTLRRVQHEVDVARAALIQTGSEATRTSAGGSQSAINIRSPVDGVVLRRLRESQAVVPAGEPLLDVGDPADLEIVSDLLSTDAVKVRPGNRVLIERWGGGEVLQGRVRRVEPSGFTKISALGVEEQRVNVIIDFEDPRAAWEALGDAYRVEVGIVIWESESVLKVPTSCLFRRGEEWCVFVVENAKAVRRVVKIGRKNGIEAEVLAGLSEGEQVVVHPSDAIIDGVSVVPRPF